MAEPISIYADGGVILKNPSEIGGTYAACHVDESGEQVWTTSGVILPADWDMPAITNNFSECYALYRGLQELPDGWRGTVYSDSKISLGRLFWSYKWAGIPDALRVGVMADVARLGELKPVLLDGHPTKQQLLDGIGKRGNPCSEFNVWCDKACNQAARKFQEAAREKVAA